MENKKVALILMRFGLAFAFIYAGISILISPENWIGYVPAFIGNIERAFALQAHAFFDLILGIWLLSNRYVYIASIIGALNLLSITLFNLTQLDIVFRDISLVFMAVALAFLSYEKR